ncbi:hypothetical protein HKW97_25650 (plasmid) [Pseudomonas luteola]|uniref:hypothetical protein n=1 Tax=Pseudomonas luteola TaxID=47886 RepID=UPI00388D39CE
MKGYKVVRTWKAFSLVLFSALIYFFLYRRFAADLTIWLTNKDLVPVLKSLKFAAFLLAAYPLLQSIGRDEFKREKLAESISPTESDEVKRVARQQLILLAGDEKRGLKISIAAFVILALLAGLGEV